MRTLLAFLLTAPTLLPAASAVRAQVVYTDLDPDVNVPQPTAQHSCASYILDLLGGGSGIALEFRNCIAGSM
ncbi:MAG TPA: hypothetical protein VD962_12605, partial [Rubricoccaceae bacterium]|nr:hypothetical protein [Rubricoccaceae bacterium]